MSKVIGACFLLLAACLTAGVYGMVHNQISYTVAPEYFTQFKFDQFGIPVDLRNRWGASLVGWQAAWWMGLVSGSILLPVGLIIPGLENYLRAMAHTFLIVVLTSLVVGLGALTYAVATFTPATIALARYPARITDPLAFAHAGHMHTFSYRGGVMGIVIAILFLLIQRSSILEDLREADRRWSRPLPFGERRP